MNTVVVKKLYLGFVVVLLFALLIPLSVSAGQEKTDVCHLNDNGNYILITIADPAVDNHIAHGDKIAGTNGLDENCVPLRYTDNGDGTVTDTQTGIIWLKDAGCFGLMDFPDAYHAALTLSDGRCGLTDGSAEGDWRLPTKEEWEATIADAAVLNCGVPGLTDTAGTGCFSDAAVADQPFVNVDFGTYWASSFYNGNPLEHWVVNLASTVMFGQEYVVPSGVWPVRGGQ